MPEPRTQVKTAGPNLAPEARLYKGGAFLADPWQKVADDEALPADGPVLVSLTRWRAERASFAPDRAVGVTLAAAERLETSDDLERLALVVLTLPKFTDGRAYSTARRLREQFGWRGELRATGDVLLDQLTLLARCGFDAFEITHAPTLAALDRGALPGLSHVYQPPTSARRLPAFAREALRRRA